MLKKAEKKTIVIELAQQIKGAKAAVFCNFHGLPTKDIQKLRALLRKEKITYQVVKISLLKRAVRLAGLDPASLNFNFPVSVSVSAEDEVAAAKILQTFAKTNDKLKLVSGILNQELIDAAGVMSLASLPSKPELRGQLVGVLAAPLRGLVSALSGNLRGLVNVLNAIGSTK